MISTLRRTVEAMGGSLALVAQFPGNLEKPNGRKLTHVGA
jgi:hypothetical protein